jgi:cellulose synthase/poly-beta-1,6-N-acetylglucosamine synthase-like glycosyltransferase
LAALPGPEKRLIGQVLLAWGGHPSRQRNLAAAQAREPWLLFLDSDSRACPGLLTGLLAAAKELGAVGVGGPNLALEDEPPLGRRLDAVLGSWAASGASRARYRAVGSRRLAGEKELILCNLLLRRDVFLKAGGFREDLYPNEENELLNRLQAQGLRLAYEPRAAVRRPRRRTVGAFGLQAFRYGRGRAQQMRRNAFAGDWVNLAPAALQAALLSAFALAPRWPVALVLPLAYGVACCLSQALHPGRAWLVALRHQAYALGLWVGALQDPAPRPLAVRIQPVRLRRRR